MNHHLNIVDAEAAMMYAILAIKFQIILNPPNNGGKLRLISAA